MPSSTIRYLRAPARSVIQDYSVMRGMTRFVESLRQHTQSCHITAMRRSRARQILGSNLRVIYIVRDPVLRLISHYRHDWSLGLIKSDLRTALDEYPDLISFSCYAYQIEPWRLEFNSRNILIINFEHYVQARNEVIERVVTFLGHAGPAEFCDPTTRFNGDDRLVATGLTQRFVHSRLYQVGIKPCSRCTVCVGGSLGCWLSQLPVRAPNSAT